MKRRPARRLAAVAIMLMAPFLVLFAQPTVGQAEGVRRVRLPDWPGIPVIYEEVGRTAENDDGWIMLSGVSWDEAQAVLVAADAGVEFRSAADVYAWLNRQGRDAAR